MKMIKGNVPGRSFYPQQIIYFYVNICCQKNAEEAPETGIIFVGQHDMDCLAIIANAA